MRSVPVRRMTLPTAMCGVANRRLAQRVAPGLRAELPDADRL